MSWPAQIGDRERPLFARRPAGRAHGARTSEILRVERGKLAGAVVYDLRRCSMLRSSAVTQQSRRPKKVRLKKSTEDP